ncbi:MAG: hypothetical protein GY871_07110 [Actinomycetales bacterium]|nr:hypothetical protein [Actinomycetales bacterium]
MSIRRAYAIAAGITWFGLGLGLILTAFNVYPPVNVPPGLLGVNPDGLAGLVGRVVDSMSAFTNLSNIIVAIVFTMLARNPDRGGRVWHAVRMDSLVMISITGLIYAIVLAPNAQVEGLDIIVNALKHYIVPVMTVALWLIVGPRRQVTFASVFTAIVIPITWAAYTLIRGHFIERYPYDFLNVVAYGLPAVLTNIAGVAALGIVLGLVFWAIDRLLSGRGRASDSATPVTNES